MLRLDINLLFTVINLLILLFVVRKFLWNPIKKIIAQRQEEVEKQYTDAESTKEEAEGLKNQYQEALDGAQQEKLAILDEGRTQAGAEADRIIADAKVKAEGIVDEAKKTAEQEKKTSVRQAQEQIAQLVADATGKLVAANQNPENDRELFNQFIAKTGDLSE